MLRITVEDGGAAEFGGKTRVVDLTALWSRSRMCGMAALLLAALVTGACASKPAVPQAEVAQRVTVRQPNHFDHPLAIDASGNVEAAETAYLSFQVSGQVSRVHVEEGELVRAGQLLAELDGRDYQYRANAAASQAVAAGATLGKVDAGVRRQELAQAKVDLDRTADEYGRLKALYERGSLTANDYRKSEAAWMAARERYSLAAEGSRQEDKLAARETLHAAESQESVARKALADTRLTAPFAGIIVKRDIENGVLAGPGRPAMVLMNLNPAKVRAGVPEAEIGKVRIGQRATVRVASLGDRILEGRVETIGYAADPASRTFAVKISVPNGKLELRAGMVAEAKIETGEKVSAVTLPVPALVRDAHGVSTVFVLFADQGRVYARRVETGTVYGREVEILSGVAAGERVVIAGQQLVHDGSLVAATEATAAEAGAGQ